jgi:hypothetical protein
MHCAEFSTDPKILQYFFFKWLINFNKPLKMSDAKKLALANLRSYKCKTTLRHNPEMLDMITSRHRNPNSCTCEKGDGFFSVDINFRWGSHILHTRQSIGQ